MSLEITVGEKQPGLFEVSLDGRLDTGSASQLERTLEQLLDAEVRGVRLNLAALSYISSMGLRAVFTAAKQLRARHGVFQVANLQPQIRKVFEIVKALPDISVFASIEEADEYFEAMQNKVLGETDD